MNNMIIIVPIISSILFIILRLIENILLENKFVYTIKIIIIDAIVVFFVTLLGYYLSTLLINNFPNSLVLYGKQTPITNNAEIFTDQPNF